MKERKERDIYTNNTCMHENTSIEKKGNPEPGMMEKKGTRGR